MNINDVYGLSRPRQGLWYYVIPGRSGIPGMTFPDSRFPGNIKPARECKP